MSAVLIGIAFVVGFGLLWWKFVWPDMVQNFQQMRESERKLGPVKFTAMMAGLFSWIGVFVWLAMRVNYPEAYGHPCNGRGCFFHDLWFSPLLLRTHHWDELMLFLWYWSMPVFVAGILIRTKFRKLRGMKFSFYADDEGPQR